MVKRKSTFIITLSGISAALALVFIVLSFYSPVAKLSFVVLAEVCLLLPLCVRSVWGTLFAYLAAGAIGIACTSPLGVVPFALLFGIHAVLLGIGNRYLPRRWYISLPIKIIVFNAGLYGVFTLYGLGTTINNLFNALSIQPAYWAIALVGSVLWVAYDFLLQYVLRWLMRRLRKITVRYVPNATADANQPAPQNTTTTATGNDLGTASTDSTIANTTRANAHDTDISGQSAPDKDNNTIDTDAPCANASNSVQPSTTYPTDTTDDDPFADN